MLQNQPLEAQVAISSKSSPGDLQNLALETSKMLQSQPPGGTSGHQLQI